MYDVIVIGAGSAGAVIATRATEKPGLRVLLVEAGNDYTEATLPKDLRDGNQNSMRLHDWGYRMRPSPLQPILFEFPRGRVVGGSSAVNTCIALRGEPSDYDEWAALGHDEWSFDKCLPAFKRLETDADFDDQWHGTSGPLPVRRHPPSELTPWSKAFLDAALAEGFPYCEDSNRPGTQGVGPHAMNKVNGERMSVARSYLTETVRKREGFELITGTLVLRVIVKNGRAVAIEAQRRGHVWRIEAKLIVLASGAIGTPHLLLRSGLGPEESVLNIGAPFIKEVPGVAEQILEHPGAAIFQRPIKNVVNRSDPLIQCVLRTGNVQIQAGSKVPFPDVTFRLVGMMCHVRKPKGVGRMVFNSADPEVGPRLDFNALEHPDDRKDALEAMQLAHRLTERPEMAQYAVPFFPRRKVRSDASRFEQWLRKWCGIGYHPCGTAPMGKSCDQYGRVHGVEGLVVADASLMPTIPTSNINVPTIMIGERFGEWIRDGKLG